MFWSHNQNYTHAHQRASTRQHAAEYKGSLRIMSGIMSGRSSPSCHSLFFLSPHYSLFTSRWSVHFTFMGHPHAFVTRSVIRAP